MSASRPDLSFSDKSEESSFFSFFLNLPKKPSTTIRIFQRQDFYTCHGDDALFIAENIYKTTSALKYLGSNNEKYPSVSMSQSVFENFIKEVVVNGQHKIEIYEKDNNNKGGRKNSWKIVRQASPGNLEEIEDLLPISASITTNPIVLAFKLSTNSSQKCFGTCFIDGSQQTIGLLEFLDNELFSNFEALLIQLGVRECVVASSNSQDYDMNKIYGILDRCGIVISEVKSSDFSSKDIEQDLSRLLKTNSDNDNDNDNESESFKSLMTKSSTLSRSLDSASALIKYMGLLSSPTNFNSYKLIQHSLGQYMRLDSSALRALNLMPSSRDSNKSMSLFGLLNVCKTAAGSRLLTQWIKQPLLNLDDINKRLDLVEVFVNDSQLRQLIQEDHLSGVPDIHRLSRKLIRKNANLEQVIRIYQLIIKLPDLIDTLKSPTSDSIDEKSNELLEDTFITNLTMYYKNLLKLQELVETTVDLESLDDHEFIIKADFDDYLTELKTELNSIQADIQNEHLNVADDLNLDSEKKLKLDKHHIHGYVMRVTRNDGKFLRGNKKFIEVGTVKAGIYFTTLKMKSLSSRFEEITAEYEKTQSTLVKEVVSITSTYTPVLEKLSLLLAKLDVIVSFAHVSCYSSLPYVRPKMNPPLSQLQFKSNEDGEQGTILIEARHPCMEAQDDITFISNDVKLINGKSQFAIITGPNMGGKSTYIRQIGVIVLMAQIGCFVPCSEAQICIADSILARVGASDSQLKGVSTFMAEMLETATILKSATKNSLIIIDELGRGTSTYDGFGLAWSISEYIIKKIGCLTLFATHFHELTNLADENKAVENLHVVAHIDENMGNNDDNESKFEGDEITLLYKVERGISDQSFGIHVAEVVKFPQKVINMAKRKASELEDTNESINKKKMCNKDEIVNGTEILKELLKKWSKSVDIDSMSSEEIILKLKGLVTVDYKNYFETNPFLKGVLEL